MPLFEAVKLPRLLQRLAVPELRRHYKEDENWQPDTGQQIPIEIERLEQLSETNLFDVGTKLTERDVRTISRAIQRDGVFIGRNYVVRKIEGAKTAPY